MEKVTGNEIKKMLKKHGFDTRKISVQIKSTGSIYVYLSDASIDREQVQNVLSIFERVYRCEVTGELLSGANRYVIVQYSVDCLIPEPMLDAYMYIKALAESSGINLNRTQFQDAMRDQLGKGYSETQVAHAYFACDYAARQGSANSQANSTRAGLLN